MLFHFDRACAHAWVPRQQPRLATALGSKQVLPVRKVSRLEAFLERFPDVAAVLVAGTERPVQRPKDSQRQKEHYSGKKKRHTRKHIIGSTRQKRVLIRTKARPGTVHDQRQLDEEDLVGNMPEAVAVEGDLGFQGLHNEFENSHLPHKKPKGKELTDQQQEENRAFSRHRVGCEHAHAGSKRYNAVTAVSRKRVPDCDARLMLKAAGWWHFYLEAA